MAEDIGLIGRTLCDVRRDDDTSKPSLSSTGGPSRPSDKRDSTKLVGLMNQGATCYLNSLIQLLFHTPEIRDSLFRLGPQDLGLRPFPPEEEKKESESTPLKAEETRNCRRCSSSNPEAEATTAAAAGAPSTAPDASGVSEAMLWEMGFPAEMIARARELHPRNNARAMEWMLAGGVEEEADPFPLPDSGCVTHAEADDINETGRVYNLHENFHAPAHHTPAATPAPKPATPAAPPSPSASADPSKSQPTPTQTPTSHAPTPTTTKKEAKKKDEAPRLQPCDRPIAFQMQRLFAFLRAADEKAVSTLDLTTSFGWYNREAQAQHDIQELNKLLFEALEANFRHTPCMQLIERLYRGETANKIECTQCGYVSEHTDSFLDIPLLVKGYKNVDESLAESCKVEMLNGDNQYRCSGCNQKVDAKRFSEFRTLPPILTLGLQRLAYDFVMAEWHGILKWEAMMGGSKADKREKVNSQFAFPMVLDMTPYAEPGLRAPADQPHDMTAYEAFRHAYEERRAQMSKKNAPAQMYFGQVNPASRCLYDLAAIVIHSGGAYGGCDEVYICADDTLCDLAAIVIHSGGAYGGHYHALVRDLHAEGDWSYDGRNPASTTETPAPASDDAAPAPADDNTATATTAPPEANETTPVQEPAPHQPEVTQTAAGEEIVAAAAATAPSGSAEEKGEEKDKGVTPDGAAKDGDDEGGEGEEGEGEEAGEGEAKPTDGKAAAADTREVELFRAACGEWYDFNDSSVRPITAREIVATYGGKTESAYILLYRRRDYRPTPESLLVPVDQTPAATATATATSVSVTAPAPAASTSATPTAEQHTDGGAQPQQQPLATHTLPLPDTAITLDPEVLADPALQAIPPHMVPEVAYHNQQLARDRAIYQQSINQLEVTLYWPGNCVCVEGVVIPNQTTAAAQGTQDGGEEVKVTVDRRWTVQRAVEHLVQTQPAEVGALPAVHLYRVQNRKGIYMVIKAFEGQELTLESLGLQGGDGLLVWADPSEVTCHEDPQKAEQEAIRERQARAAAAGCDEDNVPPGKMLVYVSTGLIQATATAGAPPVIPSMSVFVDTEGTLWQLKCAIAAKLPGELFLSEQELIAQLARGDQPSSTAASAAPGTTTPATTATTSTTTATTTSTTTATTTVAPPSGTAKPAEPSLEECKKRAERIQVYRFLPGGGLGDELQHNERQLKSLGVEASMADQTRTEVRTATLEKSTPLQEAKLVMATMIGRDPTNTRVRQADIWGGPGRILDELHTLHELNIADEDLVLLEEGKPPLKGQITLHTYVLMSYREDPAQPPPHIAALLASLAATATATPTPTPSPAATPGAAAAPTTPSAPAPADASATGVSPAPAATAAVAASTTSGAATPTPATPAIITRQVPVPSGASRLLDPAALSKLLETDAAVGDAGPDAWAAMLSWSHLPRPSAVAPSRLSRPSAVDPPAPYLLRYVTPVDISSGDTLDEYRQRLIREVPLFAHGPSPAHLRLIELTDRIPCRLLKDNGSSLKRNHLADEHSVAVEVLDQPETPTPPEGSPVQLIAAIAAHISGLVNIPQARLSLARYMPYAGEWKLLEEFNPADAPKKSGNKKNKQQQQGSNPGGAKGKFALRDGDFVAFMDMGEEPSGQDNFNAHDECTALVAQAIQNKDTKKTARRRDEPVLKIHF
ncbi:putative ubiquitin carboxyl-terminal hydrolase 7 [Paratrimastix pyriformis]|uniref:Ubiquitin carboxyl-terminal hydrolase 7 n=1 Tax=Paratrimastix pyriformis TaxID=342808 RepID=A0ABQ8UAX6_9EUKA|nr:putative ubiquitin carboxyl-terminal hydrolase 7 [Paratrimastix pyriformis]